MCNYTEMFNLIRFCYFSGPAWDLLCVSILEVKHLAR